MSRLHATIRPALYAPIKAVRSSLGTSGDGEETGGGAFLDLALIVLLSSNAAAGLPPTPSRKVFRRSAPVRRAKAADDDPPWKLDAPQGELRDGLMRRMIDPGWATRGAGPMIGTLPAEGGADGDWKVTSRFQSSRARRASVVDLGPPSPPARAKRSLPRSRRITSLTLLSCNPRVAGRGMLDAFATLGRLPLASRGPPAGECASHGVDRRGTNDEYRSYNPPRHDRAGSVAPRPARPHVLESWKRSALRRVRQSCARRRH